MKMNGEEMIAAPREIVWQAMNDTAVLMKCIPGCQSITRHSPTEMEARVVIKVGPVKAGFTGVVKLSAANPYGGTITVSNGNNGIIASTVNRILQLNHLNALSNATLNLDSVQTNLVSFTSGANTGVFNVGALSGSSSQALSDTAGSAVTLSVGGNNASSTYSGALSGNGSLIKVGAGTLMLSGASTYKGGTTIKSGTLELRGTIPTSLQ